jgi:hypothetical protein
MPISRRRQTFRVNRPITAISSVGPEFGKPVSYSLTRDAMASELRAPVAEHVLRDFSKNLHRSTKSENEALTK